MSVSPKRLLVIDDSPLSRSNLEAMLLSRGYEVALAADGEDGLARIPGLRPDLILIDVVMPQLNGWETCRRIRALPGGSRVPIVIVTSKNAARDVLQSFEAGANEFINKPIDQEELLSAVARLLDKSGGPPANG